MLRSDAFNYIWLCLLVDYFIFSRFHNIIQSFSLHITVTAVEAVRTCSTMSTLLNSIRHQTLKVWSWFSVVPLRFDIFQRKKQNLSLFFCHFSIWLVCLNSFSWYVCLSQVIIRLEPSADFRQSQYLMQRSQEGLNYTAAAWETQMATFICVRLLNACHFSPISPSKAASCSSQAAAIVRQLVDKERLLWCWLLNTSAKKKRGSTQFTSVPTTPKKLKQSKHTQEPQRNICGFRAAISKVMWNPHKQTQTHSSGGLPDLQAMSTSFSKSVWGHKTVDEQLLWMSQEY